MLAFQRWVAWCPRLFTHPEKAVFVEKGGTEKSVFRHLKIFNMSGTLYNHVYSKDRVILPQKKSRKREKKWTLIVRWSIEKTEFSTFCKFSLRKSSLRELFSRICDNFRFSEYLALHKTVYSAHWARNEFFLTIMHIVEKGRFTVAEEVRKAANLRNIGRELNFVSAKV